MALLSIAQDYVNGQVFHESAQANSDKIDNIQYWVNVELIAAFALYAGSLVPKAIISSFLFGSIPGKVVGLSVSLVATAVFLHGTTHFIALNYPNAFAKFTSVLKIQGNPWVPNYNELFNSLDLDANLKPPIDLSETEPKE
ncbi:MAG: hypothetical protein H7A40_02880 [Chlamydiales bacterium]|nr:hypothetical protein [Chlamydiales bacterium]